MDREMNEGFGWLAPEYNAVKTIKRGAILKYVAIVRAFFCV